MDFPGHRNGLWNGVLRQQQKLLRFPCNKLKRSQRWPIESERCAASNSWCGYGLKLRDSGCRLACSSVYRREKSQRQMMGCVFLQKRYEALVCVFALLVPKHLRPTHKYCTCCAWSLGTKRIMLNNMDR